MANSVGSPHSPTERSVASRALWVLGHLVLLSLAAWLLLGGGMITVDHWLGRPRLPGDPGRRAVLLSFGVVLWLRMTLTATYLLRRRVGWEELAGVLTALSIYQVGFALLGAAEATPLGSLDAFAILLFVAGSAFNTGAELQRKRFKDNPANRGKLYTGGLFRLARHINYFGDTLWVTGWALLTHSWWAAPVPFLLAIAFVGYFIPSLARYLRARYGEQYDAWARETKMFIPFIY